VGSGYGAETSAPVFQVVAQQVLEYLGVPHDQPLKSPKELLASAPEAMPDDAPSANTGDLTAMFDEINNLPADDPLRSAANGASSSSPQVASPNRMIAPTGFSHGNGVSGTPHILHLLPAKVVAAFAASGGANSAISDTVSPPASVRAPLIAPPVEQRVNGSVVVDAGQRVAVPSFAGAALRKVVETAAGVGLRVEPVGSGIAREQVPAAGTSVPMGTEVVVRFER